MRTSYRICKHCGALHALHKWPHNCLDEPPQRSEFPAPYIQNDNLPGGIHGLRSMADGRMYDSKSRYLRGVKNAGCEVIGNERSHTPAGYRPPDNHMTEKRADQIAAEGLQRYEQETGKYETQRDQTYRVEP